MCVLSCGKAGGTFDRTISERSVEMRRRYAEPWYVHGGRVAEIRYAFDLAAPVLDAATHWRVDSRLPDYGFFYSPSSAFGRDRARLKVDLRIERNQSRTLKSVG